ncbi:hypothetical protein GCM10010324_57080 [Streptomyces hiroshimensis]|uniref:Uncharacterized protein n=1 Tax=Streptomyces hiroshimensis TaxID=66424 RepID=A0ABQ2Z6A0_9ACTN|nr:hypothetical protein GCM10010324_57080 [Streptomyces hiroshimensis]
MLRLSKPPRGYDPRGGRPPKHGKEFGLARPESWPEPSVPTVNDTPRYGKVEAEALAEVVLPGLDGGFFAMPGTGTPLSFSARAKVPVSGFESHAASGRGPAVTG